MILADPQYLEHINKADIRPTVCSGPFFLTEWVRSDGNKVAACVHLLEIGD